MWFRVHWEEEKKMEFSISKEHFLFMGHFPENPILPGTFLVEIALYWLKKKRKQDENGVFVVRNAKFLAPILPDEKLWFEWSEDKPEIGFSAAASCSSVVRNWEIICTGLGKEEKQETRKAVMFFALEQILPS